MVTLMRTVSAGIGVMAFALAAACSSQPASAPPPAGAAATGSPSPAKGAKPHPFRGKVEKIDKATSSVIVAGEDVEGWMPAMTMVYEVRPPEVFEKLAVGDQIAATVYDGDFKSLHEVKVLPPPK